jgi:hypothetical protein
MVNEDKPIDNKVLQVWNKKDNAFAADNGSEMGYGPSNTSAAGDDEHFQKVD